MTLRHYFVRLDGRTYMVLARSREAALAKAQKRYGR